MRHTVIAICWFALGAGCINLDPPVDPTRYFVMNGPDQAAEHVGQAVEVKVIGLEPYLASPRMVVRLDANELRFSDVHRWAEPLADNIRSVLSGYLVASSGGANASQSGGGERRVVRVFVHAFEGRPPDEAHLVATWSVEDLSGSILAHQRSEHTVSGWNGTDYQHLATLLESTVSLLAEEIAAAL